MSAESLIDISTRGDAASDLAALVRRLQLSAGQIDAIADAVRHCPRGIAEVGRALAHGGKERGVVGPSENQDATRHLEHALDHLLSALAHPDATTDTGLLEATHAGARLALAIQVVTEEVGRP